MKIFKTILFSIILSLLFTFCANRKSEENSERLFTNVELIGKWNQIMDESLKNKSSKIKSIHLVNDTVAEIHLIDEKVLMGKWEDRFEKESADLGIAIESDIKITYNTDNQNANILLLKVFEKDTKLIMSAYELQFEKE